MAAVLRSVEGGKARKSRPAQKRPARPAAPPKALSQPDEATLRRHKQDMLVSLTSKHRAIDTKIDSAMAVVDELKGQKKEVRTAIGNVGFRLDLFDEAYGELRMRTSRIDLEAKEVQRDMLREALGLPTGPADMFKGLPTAARDAREWEIAGYRAALNDEAPDTEAAKVPGPFINDFMRGYNQVTERNAAGLKQLVAEAKKPPPSLPEGESVERPDWSQWDVDHQAWSDEAKALFQTWYEGLDPAIEPDVVHAGVKARIAYLDEVQEEPFVEMSDEERAAQAGRAKDDEFL
jgi:hypothetical protein